jgi:ubiquinol-cytochrome c reductase cytochrome c subunit
MPLDAPGDPPLRTRPAYGPDDIAAIVAYVGSLGGPPIPDPHPERGSLREGLQAFTEHCAGCHQVAARGGIVTGAAAPALDEATPVQIAEAVRTGPYLMPVFPPAVIGERELDSIIRYIELTRDPDNRGGAGIGNIGPIPEGMVAWLVAGVALLIVARLIGERTPS